MNGNNLEYVQK